MLLKLLAIAMMIALISALTPPAYAGNSHYVRVTYYLITGKMADGVQTYNGAAACSYNFSFGTRLRFPDGRVVTCHDRGPGLSASHVDVWAPSAAYGRANIARAYGDYTTVEEVN